MKQVLINLLLLCSLSALGGCEGDRPEEKKDFTVKSKLVGTWIEQLPCDSCNTIMFTDMDSVIQISNLSGERLPATFQILPNDSIKVTRFWEIENHKKATSHKILFNSTDTLKILQFLPVDFGLTGFDDVKLVKIN